MFAEDLAPFFADFQTSAQCGDRSADVLFDAPEHDILGGRATSAAYAMTYRTDSFPDLTHGDQIAILDGRYAGNYSVIAANAQSDGAISIATLQRNS